jgi:hypothetical protein
MCVNRPFDRVTRAFKPLRAWSLVTAECRGPMSTYAASFASTTRRTRSANAPLDVRWPRKAVISHVKCVRISPRVWRMDTPHQSTRFAKTRKARTKVFFGVPNDRALDANCWPFPARSPENWRLMGQPTDSPRAAHTAPAHQWIGSNAEASRAHDWMPRRIGNRDGSVPSVS